MRYTCLLLILAAAVPAFCQTTQLQFLGAREDYQVGGAFAVADFNGDGFPDIATSNSGNEVVILLNDKTGHFVQSAAIPGGQGSYFAAGDFNRDGLIDVAFTTYNGVYIALGAGNGTLRTVTEIQGGSGGDLKVLDLNGDGKLDVVVGGYGLTVFFGNGDGTLKTGVSLSDIQSPFAVGDINGDGKADIVGGYNHNIVTYLSNGAGGFTAGPAISLGTTAYTEAIAVGDLNGDGKLDLVASTSLDALEVYTGDGTGNFTLVSSTALTYQVTNVALLDVNSDGKLDLLYDKVPPSHYPATNLVLQLGNGDGTFGANTVYATAGAQNRILLAATRQAGLLDLLTGGLNEISILPNKGSNTFAGGSFLNLSGVLQSTVSGDFNHDGIRDLVVGVRLSTSVGSASPDTNSQFAGAYVLLGTGVPSAAFSMGQRFYVPPDVLALATADFNKDGNPDLAFLTGQDLVIYTGNGDGTFTVGAQYPCTCSALTVGDFNGDGKPDIATNGVFLYLGNGDGTFANPLFPFVGSGNYIGTTDLNGDGKADLIVALTNSSYGFMEVLGNGDGTFSAGIPFGSVGLGSGVIGDFNGDGLPDFADLTSYGINVYLNTAAGLFALSSSLSTGGNSKANTIAAADFNHDGHLDLVAPGLDMMIFTGNGDGTFALPVYFGSANYPNVIIAADFDDFGTAKQPDLIGVGQNGAVSTLFNQTQ